MASLENKIKKALVKAEKQSGWRQKSEGSYISPAKAKLILDNCINFQGNKKELLEALECLLDESFTKGLQEGLNT